MGCIEGKFSCTTGEHVGGNIKYCMLWGAQVGEGKLASTMIKGVLYNKLISHEVTKDQKLRN